MKKYLMGMTAIVLAIGLNAFKPAEPAPKKFFTDYYWFQVKAGLGDQSDLANSEVTYLNSGLTATAPSGTCITPSIYNCVVGFSASQVDTSPSVHLKTGDQTIQAFGNKRATK